MLHTKAQDPWRLYMEFIFDWPNGFGEEDLWKLLTDDGACLYYKLTNEPSGFPNLTRFLHQPYTFYCENWANVLINGKKKKKKNTISINPI